MDCWVQTNEDMNPIRVEGLSEAEANGIVKLLQALAGDGELVFIRDCSTEEDIYENYASWNAQQRNVKSCGNIKASTRKFTRYPKYSVQASQKIVAYVTPEEDDAWNLLDAYYEREWGEIPYNESASQILITEFPWDYNVSQDGSSWSEGSGAVVLNLKDHEVSYRIFEDDMREKVIKYPSLEALVEDFIQPLHDGTLTDEDLKYRCEDYLL